MVKYLFPFCSYSMNISLDIPVIIIISQMVAVSCDRSCMPNKKRESQVNSARCDLQTSFGPCVIDDVGRGFLEASQQNINGDHQPQNHRPANKKWQPIDKIWDSCLTVAGWFMTNFFERMGRMGMWGMQFHSWLLVAIDSFCADMMPAGVTSP